jgi:hypothetical protein
MIFFKRNSPIIFWIANYNFYQADQESFGNLPKGTVPGIKEMLILNIYNGDFTAIAVYCTRIKMVLNLHILGVPQLHISFSVQSGYSFQSFGKAQKFPLLSLTRK